MNTLNEQLPIIKSLGKGDILLLQLSDKSLKWSKDATDIKSIPIFNASSSRARKQDLHNDLNNDPNFRILIDRLISKIDEEVPEALQVLAPEVRCFIDQEITQIRYYLNQ